MRITRARCPGSWIVAAALSCGATSAAPAGIQNLTGLPTYPNLSHASMDGPLRIEALGRRCSRFTGTTEDSLGAVESWYRRILLHASETNLNNDELFRSPDLSGIKLALGLDYVAMYQIDNQPIIIELHRCDWVK